MAINLTNILLDLQKRANAVTINTSPIEILNVMKAVKKVDGSSLVEYDSDGGLPDAPNSNQKLAYVNGAVKFNNGKWDMVAQSGKTTSSSGVVGLAPVAVSLVYPGLIDGYATGGNSSPIILDTIQKFSFTVDGNSTDVSNLTTTNYMITGTGSKENGYALGGINNTPAINKFSFTSATDATNVGALTLGTRSANNPGNSAINQGYGYVVGGTQPADASRIEKVSFTTDGGATDVGSLAVAREYTMGSSSLEYGYNSGSLNPVATTGKTIDKFSFAADVNAFLSGYLSEVMVWGAGLSSTTTGYAAGNTRNIDKFPFAGEANGTIIGDLFSTLDGSLFQYPSGHSSESYGYVTGGLKPTRTDNIEKFSFVSETVGSQVGNLLQTSAYLGSHHV